ncbi:MAG: fibronectin type III domain-containing protein [Candidatus Sumerlaeia bacterium]|nr:fibronectin type III domain-containing protein [Candidatus Sumerlaeia bacterium]
MKMKAFSTSGCALALALIPSMIMGAPLVDWDDDQGRLTIVAQSPGTVELSLTEEGFVRVNGEQPDPGLDVPSINITSIHYTGTDGDDHLILGDATVENPIVTWGNLTDLKIDFRDGDDVFNTGIFSLAIYSRFDTIDIDGGGGRNTWIQDADWLMMEMFGDEFGFLGQSEITYKNFQNFSPGDQFGTMVDVSAVPTGGLTLNMQQNFNNITVKDTVETGNIVLNMSDDENPDHGSPYTALAIRKAQGGTLVLTETTASWLDVTVECNVELDDVNIEGSDFDDEFVIFPSTTAEVAVDGGIGTNILRVEKDPEVDATINPGAEGAGEVLVDGFEKIVYANMADVIVGDMSTTLMVGGMSLAGQQVVDLGNDQFTIFGPVTINGFLTATGNLSVDGIVITGSNQSLQLSDVPEFGDLTLYTGDFTLTAAGGQGDLVMIDPETTEFPASEDPMTLCAGRVLSGSIEFNGYFGVEPLENIAFQGLMVSPTAGVSLTGGTLHAGVADLCSPDGGFRFEVTSSEILPNGYSVTETTALNLPAIPGASLTFGYTNSEFSFSSLRIPAGGINFSLAESKFSTDGILTAARAEGGPAGFGQPFITTGAVTLETTDTEVGIDEGTITAFGYTLAFPSAAIRSATGFEVENADLSADSAPDFGVLADITMDENGVRADSGSTRLPNDWMVDFANVQIVSSELITTEDAVTTLPGERAILYEDFVPRPIGVSMYSGVRHRFGTGEDAFEVELASPLVFTGPHVDATTGTLTLTNGEKATMNLVRMTDDETTVLDFELDAKGFDFRGASSIFGDPHLTAAGVVGPLVYLFEEEKEISLRSVTFKPTDSGWDVTMPEPTATIIGPFNPTFLLNPRFEGTPPKLAFDVDPIDEEEANGIFHLTNVRMDNEGDVEFDLDYVAPGDPGSRVEISFPNPQVVDESIVSNPAIVTGMELFQDNQLVNARAEWVLARGLTIAYDSAQFNSTDWRIDINEGFFDGEWFSVPENELVVRSNQSGDFADITGSVITINRSQVTFLNGQGRVGPYSGTLVQGRFDGGNLRFTNFVATTPAASPFATFELDNIFVGPDNSGTFGIGRADFREKADPEDDGLNIGFSSGTFTSTMYSLVESSLRDITGVPNIILSNVEIEASQATVGSGSLPNMPFELDFSDGQINNQGIVSTDVEILSGFQSFVPSSMTINSNGVGFEGIPFELGKFSSVHSGYIDGNGVVIPDVTFDIDNVSDFRFTDVSIEDSGISTGGATFGAGLLQVTLSGSRFIDQDDVISFASAVMKFEDSEYPTNLVFITPESVYAGGGTINIGGRTFSYRNATFDGRGFFMPEMNTVLFPLAPNLEFRKIVVDGVRVAFDRGWFDLLGFEVNIPKSDFEPTPQGLLFTCDVVLPDAIGNPRVRIGLYITDSGVRLADLEICTPRAPIRGSKFVFPSICFEYQAGPPEAFGGSAGLTIPGLAGLIAGFLVRGGQLAEIKIDMFPDPPRGRPLGSTGVFLRQISVAIENLDRPRTTVHYGNPPQVAEVDAPIVFKGGSRFTAGPEFLTISLASGTVNMEMSDSHIRMEGGIDIISFLRAADGEMDIRWAGYETGFMAKGYAYLMAVLRGMMEMNFWDGAGHGGGNFAIRIPSFVPIVGGYEAASVGMHTRFRPSFALTGSFGLRIPPRICTRIFGKRVCTPSGRINVGVTVNESGSIDWSKEMAGLRDWEFPRTVPLSVIAPDKVTKDNQDVTITFLSNFRAAEKIYHKPTAEKSIIETVTITDPGVNIIRLAYQLEGGNATFALRLPDGTHLDPVELAFDALEELDLDEGDEVAPGYFRINPGGRDASWFLLDAQPGVYELELIDAASLGEYLVEVLTEISEPIFQWDQVANDGAAILASFSGHDLGGHDTNITVGLATSIGATDGYILADDIAGAEEFRSFEFPLANRYIAPGRYFVYATIDNGITEPDTYFYPAPIFVNDIYAPLPPQNVSVASIDGAALISWEPSPSGNIFSYRVEYTENLTSLSYDRFQSADVTGSSILIDNVVPGKTYRFAMRSLRDNRTDPMVRRAHMEVNRDLGIRDSFGETIILDSDAEKPAFLLSTPSNAVVIEMPFVHSTGQLTGDADKSSTGLPPLFLTRAVEHAFPNREYVYTPGIRTMDDEPPSLSLLESPDGMLIVGTSVVWTPSPFLEDTWTTVTLRATDTDGRSTDQVFPLSVVNTFYVEPFGINSTPPTLVEPGEEYVYQPTYSGDTFDEIPIITILEGPPGMTAENGIIRWQTAPADAGTQLVSIEANLYFENEAGNPVLNELATQNFHLEVGDTDRHIVTFVIGTSISELLDEALDSGMPAQLSSVVTITAGRGSLPEGDDLIIVQDGSGPGGVRGLLIRDPDNLLGSTPPPGRRLTFLTGLLETVDERPVFTLTEVDDNTVVGDGDLPSPVRLLAGTSVASHFRYVHVDINNLSFIDDGDFQEGVSYAVENGGDVTTVQLLNNSPLVGKPIPTTPVTIRGIAWFNDAEGSWEIRVIDVDALASSAHGDLLFVQ